MNYWNDSVLLAKFQINFKARKKACIDMKTMQAAVMELWSVNWAWRR